MELTPVFSLQNPEGKFWDFNLPNGYGHTKHKWQPNFADQPRTIADLKRIVGKLAQYHATIDKMQIDAPRLIPVIVKMVATIEEAEPNYETVFRETIISATASTWFNTEFSTAYMQARHELTPDHTYAVRLPTKGGYGSKGLNETERAKWLMKSPTDIVAKIYAFMADDGAMLCRIRDPELEIIDMKKFLRSLDKDSVTADVDVAAGNSAPLLEGLIVG